MDMFYIGVGKTVTWEGSLFQLSKEFEGAFIIMKTRLLSSLLQNS